MNIDMKVGFTMSCNLTREPLNRFRDGNCGFSESWSHVVPANCCDKVEVIDRVVENYPVCCECPKVIHVDRVVSLAGVDNALFLVGDIEGGLRMNTFYNILLSDDLIGFQAFNFPAYALIKAGDLHTLGVTTSDIQNHPISAFLRGNQHLFGGRRGELFELAPQDYNVEADKEDGCMPKRYPMIRVIDPTSLNIRYLTIEVSWYECGHFVYREIFYLIPLVCQNGNTCKGNTLGLWDDDMKCGKSVRIPCKTTDNGALKIADKPVRKCGFPGHKFASRAIPFGGFGGFNY